MIDRKRFLYALLALCAAAFPACLSVNSSEEPKVILYHLDPDLGSGPGPTLPVTIVIRPFSASAALDNEGIRYRSDDVEGGYWLDRQWSQSPATMIEELVERDLGASELFRHVFLIENAGRGDFLLGATVHRLDQEDRVDGWYAVVEISFELIRARDGSVVWHERMREDEIAADRTVSNVVRAMSRSLSRILIALRGALSKVCAE